MKGYELKIIIGVPDDRMDEISSYLEPDRIIDVITKYFDEEGLNDEIYPDEYKIDAFLKKRETFRRKSFIKML